MRKPRITSILIVLPFLLFLFPPLLAFGQVASWKWQNPLPQGNALRGVWGSSGSNVFAVGGPGTILHYDGSSWSEMSSGTTYDLTGVWGSSGSDVFAVGSGGTILHYDGSTWSEMSSGTTYDLTGVWGSSGSDVFAVGWDEGTILHYDGSSWSEMTSGTTQPLLGVWGSSGSDVFAVGVSGTILHYGTDPSVTTGAATDVAQTSATLNGTINPNGTSTNYYFEYGKDTSYGSTTETANAGSGTTDVSVSVELTGLTSGTTYHFRLVATNNSGTTYGLDVTFVTSSGGGGGDGGCFISAINMF